MDEDGNENDEEGEDEDGKRMGMKKTVVLNTAGHGKVEDDR